MTYQNSRALTLVGLIVAAAVGQACGDAPTVSDQDEPGPVFEGGDEGIAGADDNAGADVANVPFVPTTRDEEMLISAEDEVDGIADEPDHGGEGCAPSVYPSSENLTYEVTETIRETVEVEVERELASTALLLLDRSLSMREDIEGSDSSRWDTMQDILFGGEQPLLASLSNEVELGMTHFTAVRNSSGEAGSGHCVDLTVAVEDIAFEMNNFEALFAQQADIELGYGTPTGEALRAATDAFRNIETEGNKHIVVVTDGEPAHCNALRDFSSDQAVGYVLDAARNAAALGVTVHVIGIGPDVNVAHLRDMAEAGGGLYRSALTGDSLESAFSEILAAVKVVEVEEIFEEREVTREVTEERRSCSFQMEFGSPGPEAFLEAGKVRLGGELLVLDADDGWTIDESDQLVLLGSACDAYLAEDSGLTLEAELACPNRFPGYAR